MRGEAKVRNPRIIDESALHHVPAQRALQPAEKKDGEEPRGDAGRNPAFGDEPQQRHQEHDSDRASEQAVDIFPAVDPLEPFQAHVRVDLTKLGRRLISGEGIVPIRVAHGRQRPDDGLPFGDRQPGVGQARHPAHDDHREQ